MLTHQIAKSYKKVSADLMQTEMRVKHRTADMDYWETELQNYARKGQLFSCKTNNTHVRVDIYLKFLHCFLYGNTVLGFWTLRYLSKTFLSWNDPLGKGAAKIVSIFYALQFLLELFDGALKWVKKAIKTKTFIINIIIRFT